MRCGQAERRVPAGRLGQVIGYVIRPHPLALRILRWVGILVGTATFLIVVFGRYDRAVSVGGRSEVVTIRSDGSDFNAWRFHAEYLQDTRTSKAQPGPVTVQVAKGAAATFVRTGRGPLGLTFTAASGSGHAGTTAHGPGPDTANACPSGALPVGTVALEGEAELPLCDSARLVIAPQPGDAPLVASLRGAVEVGEEVRAGAGAQPLLLAGSALLFVRHGAPITWMCALVPPLRSICDRFVANRIDLTSGDAISLREDHADAQATGFIRLDPDALLSGLEFDLAAPQAALEVRRLKGEPFHISESLFERVEKSPLIQVLNATILALSLVFWFVNLPKRVRDPGEDGKERGPPNVAALLLAGAFVALSGQAWADQARLRAVQTGQALLRSRADRCYAVTPRHVLERETAATLTAPGRVLGDADMLRLVPAAPEDVALLLVRAIPPSLCPPFEGARPLDGLLSGASRAVLRLVNADGSFDRIPLSIQSVDIETFEVRPADAATTLAQGMSGGTLFVADRPAGLLVDVEDGGRLGRAARLDRVFERLAPYIGSGVVPAGAQAGAPSVPAAMPVLLSAEVVRWTAEPVTFGNRADALLGTGGLPWRVAAPKADVVLRLPQGGVLGGVALDAGGLPDPPRTIEVLVGPGERGPWRSVLLFAFEAGDKERMRTLPPTRAAFVLLRATGSQPSVAGTLALAGVRLLPP